jgi:hypothetical protein
MKVIKIIKMSSSSESNLSSPGTYFNWRKDPGGSSGNINYNKKSNSSSFDKVDTNYTSWTYKKSNKSFVRYSAGILPYTFDQNGKLLFLLGKDNDNDWSDFGGRCEFKDRNDPINTATREFYEESLGVILNIPETIKLINESNKIISKTLNGSPYYMYPIYIEYLNYSDLFTKVSQFLKYQFDSSITSKVIEKVSIRWVSIDTLLNCIENKDSSTPISLRGVFYRTISQFKENLIFLQK